jgi:pimeloyl-ACP methyl ester carboxylesterase
MRIRVVEVLAVLSLGCGVSTGTTDGGQPLPDASGPEPRPTDAGGPKADSGGPLTGSIDAGPGGLDGGALGIDAKAPENFDALDVNIYWFGLGDVSERAVPQKPNRFYDPSRPTVLYFHGWLKDSVPVRFRETYDRSKYNDNPDVAKAWIAAGWNVGAFYWNQYSDEGEVKDAEAKVYSARGPQQMRWRDASGAYHTGPDVSVMAQAVERIEATMGDFRGPEFRLVGHSLGSQLAIHIAAELLKKSKAGSVPKTLVPSRVALMDPAFLKDARDYLGNKWPGEVARESVSATKADIVYEAYRTSLLTSNSVIGDDNQGLIDMTAFVELKPWYFGALDLRAKHNMAPGWYFESFESALTVKCSGAPVPSASLSNSAVRLMQERKKNYQQLGDDAAYTKRVSDDAFEDVDVACP